MTGCDSQCTSAHGKAAVVGKHGQMLSVLAFDLRRELGARQAFRTGHRDDIRNPTRMMRDEPSFELFNPDGHSCLLLLIRAR